MTFQENDCRICNAIAARNFALPRKIAINLVAQDRSTKASLRGKRKKAAWNDDYMRQLLKINFMRQPWGSMLISLMPTTANHEEPTVAPVVGKQADSLNWLNKDQSYRIGCWASG